MTKELYIIHTVVFNEELNKEVMIRELQFDKASDIPEHTIIKQLVHKMGEVCTWKSQFSCPPHWQIPSDQANIQ